MDNPEARLDHFVHALISPLTALHGAIALIQQQARLGDEHVVIEMTALMDRSVERLRQTANLLITQAVLKDDDLIIRLPVAAFTTLGSQAWAARAKEQAAPINSASPQLPHTATAAGGLVLLVAAPDMVAFLAPALEQQGYFVLHTADAVTGVDMARSVQCDLIILDAGLGAQVVHVAEILAADPDTKMIPQMVGNDGRSSMEPFLQLSSGMVRRLFAQARAPEQLVGAVQEVIAAGTEHRRIQQRILVVDDEADISQIISLQLQGEGYLTTIARSGSEALQIAQQQRFDLIILDLLLPDIDGFTVLGGLRAQPQTMLTPIILLSALNAPREKVRGLELGADDYITKPFSTAELQARAQAAIRRSEREGGANPSTRLPGNIAIERAIAHRIQIRQPFAVCYSDLDNFKAYNDTYGFLKGDAMIVRNAQILADVVRKHGNPDDFVGHIGGDDFIVITTPDRVDLICTTAISTFDDVAPLFYDPVARASGYISGTDRQERPMRFPIVSISIAVVSSEHQPFSHPGEVAQRSIAMKKQAKYLSGSAYVVE
jgi:DNA-binding response OmpR family regulator